MPDRVDEQLAAWVAKELGLGAEDAHHLGELRVDESPELFQAAAQARLRRVREYYARRERQLPKPTGYPTDERAYKARSALHSDALRFSFLAYPEYLEHVKERLRKDELVPRWSDQIAVQAAEAAFHGRFVRHRHTPDPEGYRRYLEDVVPEFVAVLKRPVRVCLSENDLLRHAYVVATTESGKTELLKLITHTTLGRVASVVLLDPHGELAEQVARFKEFAESDRLLYLDPFLADGRTPTINPFEARGGFRDVEHELQVKAAIADEILYAFEEMLSREPGALSTNMRTVLRPCLLLLLDVPGATLKDLSRLMEEDEERHADLVEHGLRSRHERVPGFFAHRFHDPHFAVTKRAIAAKLDSLLDLPAFTRLTCGPTTVDLQRALDERKVIVVNLAGGRLGRSAAEAFGRLIIATLQSIAFRRVDQPETERVPVHLICDEAHLFITESLFTILGEARKFKLYAVLSQLMPGHNMSPERRKLLVDTTKIKFVGQATGEETQRDSAKLAGLDEPRELDRLRRGEFFVKIQGQRTFKFRTATHLLGHSHSMSEQAWARTREIQLSRYYRPLPVPDQRSPEPEYEPRPATVRSRPSRPARKPVGKRHERPDEPPAETLRPARRPV